MSQKILFVSTEVNPYSKSGGLGDVAGSLPAALREKGADVRVVLPLYKTVPEALLSNAKIIGSFTVHLAWRQQEATIVALEAENVYFIKNDYYFHRDNYYGYDDDFERFAFFSKAAVEMPGHIDFKADILHFNDWHTGLGPTYLRDIYRPLTYYANMKSLLTIHNLHYQGVFGREVLWDIGLNDGYFTNGDLEFYGKISYLKAGIVHADAVSTVSETYAAEIQTPAYGYGMEGLLRTRGAEGKLFGITNGIDVVENSPETDPRIYVNYNANGLDKKRENKRRLQEQLGLPISDAPMISMVTRLAEQKGFDILAIILEELLQKDVQLVVLGTGEAKYEDMLRHFAWKYPTKVSANIRFASTLAQRIYAGSDLFLMPSVYEPCGLGQLFAMEYGTIPIVRKTGGLADTVQHFDRQTGAGTGFLFEDYLASGLMWAIDEALKVYGTPDWDVLVKNAMGGDYSWNRAAEKYMEMYQRIMTF
ncbi:MAG: glycogen synthase GlgA [Defluviitaleaceae bacterium]|nr:glycogen synthase GlgA [Defluviitaleaceae bacterium]